jgi:hypothetical protein
MSIKNFSLKPAVLVLLAVALLSYACSRVEDNTRSGSLLIVESILGFNGGDETEETPLFSDMCESEPPECNQCGIVNDSADVTFSNEFLQIGPGSGVGNGSFLNDIIVQRYRVDYFRPNNRNTPGVDVPFGIDGTMEVRVPLNGTAGASITVVRHVQKREPPLSDLVEIGPFEDVITSQTEIKFFGIDVAGRTVSALGFLEIHFADFADEGC